MKSLILVLFALSFSQVCLASGLKPEEVRIGAKVQYFDWPSLKRVAGVVSKAYTDKGENKVDIRAIDGQNTTRKMRAVGIEIDQKCVDELCIGDSVYPFIYRDEDFENSSGTIEVFFDNGMVQINNGTGIVFRRTSIMVKD